MSRLDPKEKISILLAEYSALRAQMLQRNNVVNQLFSASGAILLAIVTLTFTQSIGGGLFLVVVLLPALLFTIRLNESDMLVTAERLIELSAEINTCAEEPLIKSETATGDSTLGYIPNFKYATRPFDKLGDLCLKLWQRRLRQN